jgi:hypothetical protein
MKSERLKKELTNLNASVLELRIKNSEVKNDN